MKGSIPIARLEKLLAHHEAIAAALRTTLQLLKTDAAPAVVGTYSVLATALQLDAQRRNGNGHPSEAARGAAVHKLVATPIRKAKGYGNRDAVRARRAKTAAILASLSTSEPRPIDDPIAVGVGPLIANGYIRKRKGGYLRTAKAFDVDVAAAE